MLTAHGPVTGELGECYRLLSRHHPMVAISEAQRAKGPHLPWAATVYNAIPVDEYPFETEKDDFVLFLGRISPEKAPDLAIKAARAAGRRIVVAAKCNEPAEHAYFERAAPTRPRRRVVRPRHHRGEEEAAGQGQRAGLPHPVGRAVRDRHGRGHGLRHPGGRAARRLDARAGGDGLTGYICDRPEELPAALQRIHALDPQACRQRVFDCFDVPDMVDG